MSATLVEYPRKPNELSDDIESFLYVITLAILRFHRTSLEDKTLSAHISMTYHNALRTLNGYYVGSGYKLLNIRNGYPGFRMIKSTSSLALLLGALWKLGQEHYATLDYQDLEMQWGVALPKDPEGSPFRLALRLPEADDVEDTEASPIMVPPMEVSSTAVSSTDVTSMTMSPSPKVLAGLRDFRSHSHMLKIFEGLYEGKWVPATKVRDLFKDLYPFLEVRSAGPTGTSRPSKRALSLVDDSSDNVEPPSKRQMSSRSGFSQTPA